MPEEPLAPGARIVRLAFGRRYLRKELLWNHLDQLVDRCLLYLKGQAACPSDPQPLCRRGLRRPAPVAALGIPLVHTGIRSDASTRAPARRRRRPGPLDRQFSFARRIEAEEATLEHASLVVASTQQEASCSTACTRATVPAGCGAPAGSMATPRLVGFEQEAGRPSAAMRDAARAPRRRETRGWPIRRDHPQPARTVALVQAVLHAGLLLRAGDDQRRNARASPLRLDAARKAELAIKRSRPAAGGEQALALDASEECPGVHERNAEQQRQCWPT